MLPTSMINRKITLIVVLTFVCVSMCTERMIKWEEVSRLTDTTCNVCILAVYLVRSKIECSLSCSGDERCKSFSYTNMQDYQCMLHTCVPEKCDCVSEGKRVKHYNTIGRTPSRLPPAPFNVSGYIFEERIAGWYKIKTTEMDWNQAQSDCIGDGGHLLVIHSQEAQDWFTCLLNLPSYSSNEYAIDGTDLNQEGVWLLHNGSAMVWGGWAAAQPNNKDGNQHCNRMTYRWDFNFKWNDDYCSDVSWSICQIDQ